MLKKIAFGILILAIALAIAAPMIARADGNPDPGANASPSGQTHGAFNKGNSVYGEPGTPGGKSDSLNSSGFGTSGGSGGGQTGDNNSAGAPWGDINKTANDPNP